MVTVTGKFVIGLDVNGERHMTFELRQKLVRDSVEAIEELGPDASQARLDIAVLARQLSLPGVNPDEITTDLLLNMDDEDIGAIYTADEAVRKKRLPPKPDSAAQDS